MCVHIYTVPDPRLYELCEPVQDAQHRPLHQRQDQAGQGEDDSVPGRNCKSFSSAIGTET